MRHDSQEARIILEDNVLGSLHLIAASYMAIFQDILREHIIDDEKMLLRLRDSKVRLYALFDPLNFKWACLCQEKRVFHVADEGVQSAASATELAIVANCMEHAVQAITINNNKNIYFSAS